MPNFLLCGLSLNSVIPIHALPGTAAPDVRLSYGICPDPASFAMKNFGWIKTNDDQTFLTIPSVGRIFIDHGRRIIVEREPDCREELLHAYLTGVCIAFLLMQRHIFTLHGSCVCCDDRTLVICGDSGAGKSTFSSSLLDNGWKLMTDDIVPVVPENGKYYAQSTFPCQKMWSDTMERRNACGSIIGTITQLSGDRQKYQVDAGDVFVYDKLPVRYVVYLTVGAERLNMREVTGFEKVDLLMRNRFIRRAVPSDAFVAEQLQCCIGLASQVRAFLVERPEGAMTENEIYQYITEAIEKQ